MATIRLIRKDDINNHYINLLKKIDIQFEINNIENIIQNELIEIWVIDDDILNIIGSATLLIENRLNTNHNIAHIQDLIIDNNKFNDYIDILIEHLIERSKIRNCNKITFNCDFNNVLIYDKYFIKKGINMYLNI